MNIYIIYRKTDAAGHDFHFQVNREFFKSLKGILKILVPRVFSAEAGFLTLVAMTLILRSMCDIWMIHNGTLIERWVLLSH